MTEEGQNGSGQDQELPNPSFQLLTAQFVTQALIELGEVPNPMSGETEVALPRARFTIDMLQIIRDKTEGNLTPEELQNLESALFELRRKFVEKSGS